MRKRSVREREGMEEQEKIVKNLSILFPISLLFSVL
jgi:hypothetical protein